MKHLLLNGIVCACVTRTETQPKLEVLPTSEYTRIKKLLQESCFQLHELALSIYLSRLYYCISE